MTAVTNPPQLDLQRIEHVLCHMPANPRLIWGRNHPVAEEKYRLLAHRIRVKGKQRPLKKLLVTSSIPGEGKTTTATNLAIVLARNGRRVMLIDADFRGPDIHESLGIAGEPGLTEVLDGKAELEQVIRCISPLGFYFLPAGRPRSNPLPLLESPSLVNALAAAEAAFEWLIIDSPPLNPFADAHSLASLADGVLLVVRWDLTPREELDHALKALRGTPLLGLVVNSYDEPRHEDYYYRYHSLPESEPEAGADRPSGQPPKSER